MKHNQTISRKQIMVKNPEIGNLHDISKL